MDKPTQFAAPSQRPIRRVTLAASLVLTLLVISGLVFAQVALRKAAVTSSYQTGQGLRYTPIDLTKTVGDMTIHLQSAYADANNIYLLSTVEYAGKVQPNIIVPPSSSWGVALITSSGATIPIMDGSIQPESQPGEATPNATPVSAQVFDSFYHFSGAAVSGNPSSLRLTLRLTPPRGFPNVAIPPHGTQLPPVDFTFTMPFDAGQVVAVGQTVTSHGWGLTLDKVVITASETRAYFHSDPSAFVYAADLHVAGRTYNAPGGTIVVGSKGSGKYAVTFNSALNAEPPFATGAPPGSGAQGVSTVAPGAPSPTPRATFQSLEGQSGEWTLKVTQLYIASSGLLDGDWDFDFTVS